MTTTIPDTTIMVLGGGIPTEWVGAHIRDDLKFWYQPAGSRMLENLLRKDGYKMSIEGFCRILGMTDDEWILVQEPDGCIWIEKWYYIEKGGSLPSNYYREKAEFKSDKSGRRNVLIVDTNGRMKRGYRPAGTAGKGVVFDEDGEPLTGAEFGAA